MREIEETSRFKKSFKKIINHKSFKLDVFELVIFSLVNDIPLEIKYKDHALKGSFLGVRECHISPDMLLLYQKDKDKLSLYLIDIGSHSNLF
jgi:mRNA interferase YafQ